MKFIGLTGSIATGKSTVAKIFEEFGCYVIDADKLVHKIYEKGEEGYKRVVEAFGNAILYENRNIDRKKLAEIVLKDKEQLKKLESIVHPIVERKRNEILSKIAKSKKDAIVIYDVPLLFEKDMQSMFDCVIVVWTDRETQIKRLMKRNNLSKEEAEKRINLQMSIDKKRELADIVIDNSKDLDYTKKQVLSIIQDIKQNKLCT
ncbi:dephospho-CoA kinase [Hippea alviniae]|uniref:dephospho-CoA kinase n=1 Tax=Hippea alviniae TaxID=1279027 RepID=UPI0003B3E084|nr:dephospho-CoA kinase [Hippea alviniae]